MRLFQNDLFHNLSFLAYVSVYIFTYNVPSLIHDATVFMNNAVVIF
nr:MAG TPA: hypothetical protein [Caudoviricetes sp.]